MLEQPLKILENPGIVANRSSLVAFGFVDSPPGRLNCHSVKCLSELGSAMALSLRAKSTDPSGGLEAC